MSELTAKNMMETDEPLVKLPKGKRWFFVSMLYAMFLFDFVIRYGVNAILPLIQGDLGLSGTQIGLLSSAIFLGMAIFVMPISFIGENVSQRRAISFCVILWSGATVLCGMANNAVHLIINRLIVGAGNSAYAPLSTAMLTSWYKKGSWGKALGFYNTAMVVGGAMGMIVFAAIAEHFGWRTSFYVIGGISLVISLLSLLLPDNKKLMAEQGSQEGHHEAEEIAQIKLNARETAKLVIGNKALLTMCLAAGLAVFTVNVGSTFISIYYVNVMGMTVTAAAGIAALATPLSLVATPVGGAILDKWYAKNIRARMWMPMVTISICGVLCALGYAFTLIPLILLGNAMYTAGNTSFHSAAHELVPAWYKSISYGTYVLFIQLLGACGPTVGGIMVDHIGVQQALVVVQATFIASFLLLAWPPKFIPNTMQWPARKRKSTGWVWPKLNEGDEMSQILFHNAHVITMEDDMPFAQAVLIQDGTILAVGSDRQVGSQAEPGCKIEDLQGKTLVPGFIDSHSHMEFGYLFPHFDAPPAGHIDSVQALGEAVRAYLQDNPVKEGRWLVGMGYDNNAFPDKKHPTRWDLDRASTNVPLVIMHASGHVGICNSKVLEICGIHKGTPDPQGGVFGHDPATGEPDGRLQEAALTSYVLGRMPLPTAEEYIEAIRRSEKIYLSNGITTAQDGCFDLASLPLVRSLHEKGLIKIDLYVYPRLDMLKPDQEAGIPPSDQADYENGVKVAGVKIFLDGSPQAKTAWLTQPYYIPPQGQERTYCGYPVHPDDDEVCAYFKTSLRHGWQILAHANGDAAIDQFIDQYERAVRETGIQKDSRPVIVHCQTVRTDQLQRMKKLGILPTFFHDHVYLWGDFHLDSVLGPERGRRISPLAEARDLGLTCTIHQDTPVIDPNMILSLHHAVNRRTSSGRDIGPEFALSPLEALRTVTTWAAAQIFEEASKGSIRPGKMADLVVLDQDPLTVPKETIRDIKVVATIKKGETVYRRQGN